MACVFVLREADTTAANWWLFAASFTCTCTLSAKGQWIAANGQYKSLPEDWIMCFRREETSLLPCTSLSAPARRTQADHSRACVDGNAQRHRRRRFRCSSVFGARSNRMRKGAMDEKVVTEMSHSSDCDLRAGYVSKGQSGRHVLS